MGGIFISHSSKNSAEAERLRDWLETQGWGRSQVFLDLQDLKSGDSWRDVLNAMGDKEAVIVCLSNEWLGSHECVREFTQAQERGKPILPIFVAAVTAPIPRFITDLQIGDATKDDGFQSLRDGLLSKRITPQSFPWPPPNEPTRSVYRGLQALDVQDAAIFFGRDADIARGLDELRRLRNGAPQRLLAILGASGAGKSSFLRAGLIARLKRDEENFLVLPVVRPERAAVSGPQGLTASISTAQGRAVSWAGGVANLAQAFADLRKPVMQRLTRNAEAARETHTTKPPTIILPLDQAEELFGVENTERAAFCEAVEDAIAQDGNAVLVATIRTDTYESLQNGWMRDRQTPFTLPAIAAGSFQEIIEGPARLAKPPLKIEPELTQQLLSDLNAADALPLLAFTLERLRTQLGQQGRLSLADYRDKLGGLSGAIQSAVDAVLGAAPSKEKLALARRLFVPALVQVDQDGVKRRVARRADIPADAQKLADQFVDQRLLVADAGTIEVAHEAILRQWPALASWIRDEYDALKLVGDLQAATSEWVQEGRPDNWMAHSGDKVADAETLLERADYSKSLNSDVRDYVAAWRRSVHAALARERKALRAQRRALTALVAVVGILVIGLSVMAFVNFRSVSALAVAYLDYGRFAVSSSSLAAARPGTTFQDCREDSALCPVMVIAPEGQFQMGSAADDEGASLDEGPTRAVSIQRFAVSQREITFAQWQACVAGGGCSRNPAPSDNGWGRGNRPVFVSWEDAQEYVAWLSQMTGQHYRLLTEAEWEYAARGVTSADDPRNGESWSFGNDESQLGDFAWFASNSENQTYPVGMKRANPFGLYDMHGNVYEWVQDCYAAYDPARLDGSAVESDAEGPDVSDSGTSCSSRVLRGGSWSSNPQDLRSASRVRLNPDYRDSAIGFRVARTL